MYSGFDNAQNINDQERAVHQQVRCVQCLILFSKTESVPFWVCESCQRRNLDVELGQQLFTFRKVGQGREQQDRHAEIIRKIAQGRLSRDLEVWTPSDGEWRWIPMQQSTAFAGVWIQGSKIAGAMSDTKEKDVQAIRTRKWTERRRFIQTFLGMAVTLGLAYTGLEQGWFVIEKDPFAVEQGDDVPVPDTLQSALNGVDVSTSSQQLNPEDPNIWNATQLLRLTEMLQSDLKTNPRQGVELLLWLQTKLLLHNPVVSDVPFPPEWLSFALSLHHPEELGHRLQAMWHLAQGNAPAFEASLAHCGSDAWCTAYRDTLRNSGVVDPAKITSGISATIWAEHAIAFEEFKHWSTLIELLRQYNRTELADLLEVEQQIVHFDFKALPEKVDKIEQSALNNLRVALWSLRLHPARSPQRFTEVVQSNMWKQASEQTKGAYALLQAGLWMKLANAQSGAEIEGWYQAGDWFEGDAAQTNLPARFQLLRTQSAILQGDKPTALKHIAAFQTVIEDPLLQFWLGLLWVQLDNLRSAMTVAETLAPDTPHHWMLKVLIAIQSENKDLLAQSLDAVARTDIALLQERSPLQQWIPPFNWRPLLEQGMMLSKQGKINIDYQMVLTWLNGDNPSVIRVADGWATGWIVQAQYAFKMEQFEMAHKAVERFRRYEPQSVTGEILSQCINVHIGREDIARTELPTIAQRERSAVWGHWFMDAYHALGETELADEARVRWYPVLPIRNLSADHYFLWNELSPKQSL